MILADKIIDLRKKNGWSQGELASQLNVSRQAVSKWEGAQSVPDLERVLQMSRLFGVSTDYLLKDEQGAAEYTGEDAPAAARTISMEEANLFLAAREANARPLALATFLCIISPLCLMLLAALSERAHSGISENAAAGAGLCVLLILVAAAVAIFIACGARTKPFAYLETEVFETAYGVEGMVSARKAQFQRTALRYNTLGTVMCILGGVPLMLGVAFSQDDLFIIGMVCVLMLMAGVGVMFFILAGVRTGSWERLLQQGEYARHRKTNRTAQGLAAVYWPVITAAFLAYSFITNDWQRSWIIWPVAAVLFAAVNAACTEFGKQKNK